MKRFRSLFFSAAVTVAWLGTMGVLLQKYVWVKTETGKIDYVRGVEITTAQWRDREDYALLVKNNSVVGATSTIIKKIEGASEEKPHYRSDFRLSFKGPLAMFGKAIEVKAAGVMDDQFYVREFFAEADLLIMKLKALGKIVNNELLLEIDKGGQIARERRKLDQPISLLEMVQSTLSSQLEIKPGNKATIPVMDTVLSMQKGILTIHVKDKEVIEINTKKEEAYRVEMTLNDIKTVMWTDGFGEVLRRQLPGGITMDKTTSTTAIQTAPVLAENLDIPELKESEFANIKLTSNDDIDKKQSPLSAMEGFLK